MSGGSEGGGSQNVPLFYSSAPPLFTFSRSSNTGTFRPLCLCESTTFCKLYTCCKKLLLDLCSSCGWCVHGGMCGLNVVIMSFVRAQSFFFFFFE